MSNRLGHFVDTRRGCGWDIQGKPNYTEGYGIYSASKDLFEDDCDRDLRDAMIKHQHKQDAYAYCVPGKGRPMLAAYRKRTDEEKRIASEADVDNRVSYVAEWLVGSLEHYAFEYIGSSFWQNIYRPIADFYANEEPLPLEDPIDPNTVLPSETNRRDIMEFVADGRTEAVKAAVWALLRQFDLPMADRKFLVIRDSEANVRKWIAAIGYSFPIQVANSISFNTCMEKLNQEPDCCYYVQNSTGLYTKIRNIQDPNQERRWFYMIAGADPTDRTSDRTANPMPNAPYLVIDGATKQAKFETDQLMFRSFLKNIATNDASIEDFCNYMNEMQGLSMGTCLCDLYDAQNALTNENAWSYSALCKALNRLTPYFTRNSVLMRYMVGRLCVEGEYASRFAVEDENNSLSLLRILYKLVGDFKITEALPVMKQMLVKRISVLLGNSRDAGKLSTYINCLKDTNLKLYSETISEVVETSGLKMVTDSAVASGVTEYIIKLFDVIDTYLNSKEQGWADFFKDSSFTRLADAVIARSMQDESLPGHVLNLLSGDSKAIDSYILRGCRFSSNNNQTVRWWHTMLQNRVSAEYLCGLISSNNIGVQEIESVLCQEIRINGYRDNLRRLFNQHLAKVPGAGGAFYSEWIKSLSGMKERTAVLRRILAEMAANTNFTKQLGETLVDLDSEIVLDQKKETVELAELVYEFSLRARVQCNNALLWKFLYTMSSTKVSRRDRDGIAGVFLQANAGGYRFSVSDSVMHSQLGGDFMERMQEYLDQPATHIIALNSFTFRSVNAKRAYINLYAQMVCTDTVKKKSNALASVLFLREMIASGHATQDSGADKLREIYAPAELMSQLDELLSAIQRELGNFRTDGIADKVISMAERAYGKSIAAGVEQIFAAAQETYKINNQGQSIFSKLFGRHKK